MDRSMPKSGLRYIFDHDTLLHLRLPFSYFLLPVFLLGISQAPLIRVFDTAIVFIALHFFIYPGSNSYNSYMDQDTGSIGGLEHPPTATVKLYYASIVMDISGLTICCISGLTNVLLLAGYIAFSKAYSWHGIRFKKRTYLGWASVMFFQGGYTYMLAHVAATGSSVWPHPPQQECILFASLIIGGSYPLTQIYQHQEDAERGDYTISSRLGIRGTFLFTALMFAAGTAVIFHYFVTYHTLVYFVVFAACAVPLVSFFVWWAIHAFRNRRYANYRNVMLMNKISATCMSLCFIIILILRFGTYRGFAGIKIHW